MRQQMGTDRGMQGNNEAQLCKQTTQTRGGGDAVAPTGRVTNGMAADGTLAP